MKVLGLILTLALGVLVAPLATEAQPPTHVPRIGVLAAGAPASTFLGAYLESFRQGLRDLGYVEGQNIAVEYRFAEGHYERLPALAAELVQIPVTLLVTLAAPAAQAAQHATRTLPIVFMLVNDPVGQGLVASLAHPGGNLTGVSTLSSDLSGKRLELLREAVPGLHRVAVFAQTSNPGMALQVRETQQVAQGVGLQVQALEIRGPEDVDRVLATTLEAHTEGLVVLPVPLQDPTPIVHFAATHRLPAIYAQREIVQAGGLMSYGPRYREMTRRAATYVDKIFKGAKPTDLPVEQPMQFELVINLRTAQALGITMPPSLLILADEVIR